MKEMKTYERMSKVYSHQEPDRVPMVAGPWESTMLRWYGEGLPRDVSLRDYFGLDHIVVLGCDTSPRFEAEIVEETDTYRIEQDVWGVTRKNFKPVSSTP